LNRFSSDAGPKSNRPFWTGPIGPCRFGYKNPPNDDEIIPPPTPEEINAIYNAASDHLKRAIMLSFFLGVRPGAVELLSMEWPQVNWHSRTILVYSADKGGPKSRAVPMHDELFNQMVEWYEKDGNPKHGHVIHYHGHPIKKIQTSWAGALKRAGIKRRVRPYDLRHQFVTAALESGADLKTVSEIVGSQPETIMRHYQHVARAAHRRTISNIKLFNDDSGPGHT
jgi:integrase